jgi:16S rRNA (guanine527-N7)-methyltransferase
MLDVGSGAGFPAIPIKVCRPHLTVHLVEAGARRVSFLKQVIRLTRLQGIRVIRGRIERDTELLHAQGYDVVTFRALAHMPRAILWCSPHLRPGGLMISFQGTRYEKTLEESSEILEKQGLILERRIPYMLPGKEGPRNMLLFRKTA